MKYLKTIVHQKTLFPIMKHSQILKLQQVSTQIFSLEAS